MKSTLIKSVTKTITCHYCGQSSLNSTLYHDGKGFVTCTDATRCLERAHQQKLSHILALELQLASLNSEREALIYLIKEKKEEARLV